MFASLSGTESILQPRSHLTCSADNQWIGTPISTSSVRGREISVMPVSIGDLTIEILLRKECSESWLRWGLAILIPGTFMESRGGKADVRILCDFCKNQD